MTEQEVKDLVAKIKPHSQQIGKEFIAGNVLAHEVVLYYEMVRRCPEHGAMVMCENAFNKWLKSKEKA